MDVKKVFLGLTLSFLLGNGVAVADYESAYSAYKAKDYKTAFKEMLPLAEKGNLDAQFHIAMMYYDGLGVKKDRSISVAWLTKGAIRGDMYAQTSLADKYFFGVGVEKNDKTAVKWYTESAEQGHGMAQVSLGRMYDNGRGVLRDFVRGYMWYNLGAYNGGFRGGKEVESIAKKMTITQIAKAQEMSNRCLESNYTDC
jgi:TPR repeat protein